VRPAGTSRNPTLFPVANTDLFDILELMSDPGACWNPRWHGLNGYDREQAVRLARESSRYHAVGAVLVGPKDHEIASLIGRELEHLDHITGPQTLVLSPTPASSDFRVEARQRPCFRSYELLENRIAGLGRTDDAAHRFESAFRSALGIQRLLEPGIVAAPSFASSAFVWIPVIPTRIDMSFEEIRILGQGGLEAFNDRVQTVPLGLSVGAALRGVLAQGQRREVLDSAKRYPNAQLPVHGILATAQGALDRVAAEIARVLEDIRKLRVADVEDSLWGTLQYLADVRTLDRLPMVTTRLACEDPADRAALHPLAAQALESAEALASIGPGRPLPWYGTDASRNLVHDYALAVVGLARCVEIEVNHSLLQWRRRVRSIEMPLNFMRYSHANGPTIERNPARPGRDVDINRPRYRNSDELLAPSVSQLMSLGSTLCEPLPSIGAPACDNADWRGIRQACSRLIELRNRAAHDQPIDQMAWEQARGIMRELDRLSAWRAFRELRWALSKGHSDF
jgi:hypothetical protein